MLETAKKYTKNLKIYNIFVCLVILLGFFLRLKGYLHNPSFWHDECALAWNIKFKSYSELFGVLNFLQVAPPLFLVCTKFLTNIFGLSEAVFRFIPTIVGCSSVIAFYFLSKKVLSNKFSILMAIFLFAINPPLISYSFELKPYELDVFLIIIGLLFFIKLDIERLDIRKALLYGVLLALMPWVSFTSVFILVSGFINSFLIRIKTDVLKKIILFFPLLVSGLIYFKISLFANYTGTSMVSGWQGYFITLNVKHFIWLFTNNLNYLFQPCTFTLFLFMLLIIGGIIFYRSQSLFFNLSFKSFCVFVLLSMAHVYPFAERLALFLLPIFILYMVKPLDLISKRNKIVSSLIIVLFIITFYPQILNAKEMLLAGALDKDEYPREMMEQMKSRIKPNDLIFINNPSESEFAYYSSFYNIKNRIIQERIEKNLSQQAYTNELNSLKEGYYWFYLPVDYVNIPIIPWVEDWSTKYETLYKIKTGKKYKGMLMYIHINKKEK